MWWSASCLVCLVVFTRVQVVENACGVPAPRAAAAPPLGCVRSPSVAFPEAEDERRALPERWQTRGVSYSFKFFHFKYSLNAA